MSSNGHRTVTVSTDERPVSYIDKTGARRELGRVLLDEFEGEDVRRWHFLPSADNSWANRRKREEGYSLGIGSAKLQFVDPEKAIGTLLDNGWQINDQIASYGGLEMTTLLTHPDRQVVDQIDWDHSIWDREGRKETGAMFHGLRVDTSLFIGRMATRYRYGVWRVVCSNGLISELLGFPAMAFRHDTWEVEKIEEFISTDKVLGLSTMPTGPVVTNAHNLRRAHTLLVEYERQLIEKQLTPQMEFLHREFAAFGPSVSSDWVLNGYLQQVDVLLNSRQPEESIHAVDLINCYTNVVSLHRMQRGTDRGVWSAFSTMDRVVETTAQFANLAGLFAN